VSASIARLQRGGALVTEVDPADRRRTLVKPVPGVIERVGERVSVPIDAALAKGMGTSDPRTLADVIATLDALASQLLIERREGTQEGNPSA
jgi:hypothetical protein